MGALGGVQGVVQLADNLSGMSDESDSNASSPATSASTSSRITHWTARVTKAGDENTGKEADLQRKGDGRGKALDSAVMAY